MKKLLSLVCVLALALAVCVPAFAEDATPGQVVETETNYVADHPEDYDAAKTLTDTLKGNTSVFVDSKTTEAMAGALLAALDNGTAGVYDFDEEYNPYDYAVIAVPNGSLVGGGVSVPANNRFTVDISWENSGYQSDLGAIVTVRVPASSMELADDYIWRNDDNQYGYVEASKDDEDPDHIYFTFFAPHFSTYRIYRPTPAAPADSNSILAQTNADLNMTAVVLAVLALVLTGSCAVVLKKRALNK